MRRRTGEEEEEEEEADTELKTKTPHVNVGNNKQTGTHKNIFEHGCEKKTSANLAGLLVLPCTIGEFSCVPPHNEEENKKVHTNYQLLYFE